MLVQKTALTRGPNRPPLVQKTSLTRGPNRPFRCLDRLICKKDIPLIFNICLPGTSKLPRSEKLLRSVMKIFSLLKNTIVSTSQQKTNFDQAALGNLIFKKKCVGALKKIISWVTACEPQCLIGATKWLMRSPILILWELGVWVWVLVAHKHPLLWRVNFDLKS